jgi:hypothetical protein
MEFTDSLHNVHRILHKLILLLFGLTLRGPESKATRADCPADGEWLGIRFKLGTFIPALLPGNLRDRRDVTLPGASKHRFWLNGSAWEYPDFENADVFVARLVRRESSRAPPSLTLCCTTIRRHCLCDPLSVISCAPQE